MKNEFSYGDCKFSLCPLNKHPMEFFYYYFCDDHELSVQSAIERSPTRWTAFNSGRKSGIYLFFPIGIAQLVDSLINSLPE